MPLDGAAFTRLPKIDLLVSEMSSVTKLLSLHPLPPVLINAVSELCSFCAKENAILPSLEAFEMGLRLPSVYMVFHEFFFKSSMGDAQWKAACLEPTSPTARFAPPQGEAFAMLLLKNNYFAWLWEAKQEFKELLVTDYDSDKERSTKANIGDAFLKFEINLDPTEEDDDLVDGDINCTNIIVQEGDPLYQELHKKTEAALKKLRRTTKNSEKYNELKKRMDQSDEDERYLMNGDVDRDAEHRNKRRRVLKSFREYTNPQDHEGRFKGWSHRAAADMVELVNKLNNDGSRERLFRMAYRMTYHNKQGGGKKKKGQQESPPVNYENDIWGLTDIPYTVL